MLDPKPTIDTITPGKLTDNGVVLTEKRAGGTGIVTVTFRLDNPLPASGAIAVTFPEGFVISTPHTEAKFLGPSGVQDEDLTVVVQKHSSDERTTALIIRTGSNDLPENEAVILEPTNIRNPHVSRRTQKFEIRTSLGK